MTINDIIRKYKGEFADVEIYEAECIDNLHSDRITVLEDCDRDTDYNEPFDIQWFLMDEEEYDQTINANSGVITDFGEWYDDPGARVLVIAIRKGCVDSRIKAIRDVSGLSQSAFSKKYNIPLRTIQGWELGEREAPPYVLEMLERLVWEDKAEKRLIWGFADFRDGMFDFTPASSRRAALDAADSAWEEMSAFYQGRTSEFYAGLFDPETSDCYTVIGRWK